MNFTDPLTIQATTTTSTSRAICPDLLRLSDLGEADNWRGHMVRGFFRLLQVLTGI
ncbi:MAG: hypothetical protein ACRD0W_09575 [Acidimicrobiales bacterium]